MGYTVTVNHPHFPEGTIFNVGGLDRVPNGGSLEVDDEMERLYVMSNGRTLEDGFANDAMVKVSGSSALDKSELDALLEAYAPVEFENEAPVSEEAPSDTAATTESEESPAWLQKQDEEGDVNA